MRKQFKYIIIIVLSFGILFSFQTAFAGNVDIHGFVSQGYLRSSDNNFLNDSNKGSFEFNEMGINFGYDTGSDVTVGAQLFARDLGDFGNDKVSVAWAFGDYKWKSWMGFRAGMMKFALGLYNTTRDIDSLRTTIILPQSVYNEWYRDVSQGTKGAQIYGHLSLGYAGLLDYTLQVSGTQVPIDSGTAKFFLDRNSTVTTLDAIDVDTTYGAALIWYTPLDGLLLGVSGFSTNAKYTVNNSTAVIDNPDFRESILSVEYTLNRLTLASECMYTTSRNNVYLLSNPSIILVDDERIQNTNYYFSGAYRFTDWFEGGLYYSKSEAFYNGTGPDNELKDICLSTRFDISPAMVFKLETHFMKGLFGVDPGTDGTRDDKWNLYAAKVSYTF
ncbi:MAG: hypothetical protein KJ737_18050 [Proteobacteria bacterium]|nr:hypothetical protein [Pseudomonadota bacterium]